MLLPVSPGALELVSVNIIYIDDDAANRALLRDMLAVDGIEIIEAADARTGLKLIEKSRFDLIFMDLRMPDMNGLTAIRQLRASDGDQRAIPIVVVTADPSEGVKSMCRAAGATDFLEKPISMDKLFAIVASIRKQRAAAG